MKYEFSLLVERQLTEVVEIEVEADDEEEAKDLAYTIVTEHPNSSFAAERYIVRKKEYGEVDFCDFIEEKEAA